MSEETLTVRVPLAVRKRGGRRVVLAPEQAAAVPEGEPANWTLVKNLARAFRWQRMLESREYAKIAELAKAEGLTDSYVSRMLRLASIPAAKIEAAVGGLATLDRWSGQRPP